MTTEKSTPPDPRMSGGATVNSLRPSSPILSENSSGRQDDWREQRGKFFAQVFGRREGYLCLAKKTPFAEAFFHYPQELDNALDWIDAHVATYDLYFCAQLLEKPQRRKEHINKVAQLWADLDECHPDLLKVPPSIAWQTSPKHYQAIWRLYPPLDAEGAERLSHAVALAHKGDGVDQSGWDLTQLLRIPLTYNFKEEYGVPHPEITIVEARPGDYRPYDFSGYPPAPQGTGTTDGTQEPPQGTGESAAEILARYRGRVPDWCIRLFNEEPEEDWSKALWALLCELARRGLTESETFTVAAEAKCNKYERDGRTPNDLRRDVRKAHAEVRTERTANDDNRPAWASLFVAGGSFILDAPALPPSIWGDGSKQVIWAQGEAFMPVGPQGIGKTTLAQQTALARMGLRSEVLGYPVEPGKRNVLYLAMDRPAQVQRSFARMVTEAEREILDKRLVIWKGPLPEDLVKNPKRTRWYEKRLQAYVDYYQTVYEVFFSLGATALRTKRPLTDDEG